MSKLIDKVVEDRVVLINDTLLQTEAAGGKLFLPDVGTNVVKKALVKHVGPTCTQVAVGDIAVYVKGSGIEILYENVRYIVMRECDVMFTLDKSDFKIDET